MKKLIYIAILLAHFNSFSQITSWAAQKQNTNYSVYGSLGFSAAYGYSPNGYITPITNKLKLPFTQQTNVIENFAVYPNPAQDFIKISLKTKQKLKSIHIELLNLNGQKIFDLAKNSNLNKYTFQTKINLSPLPAGVYLLRITINKTSAFEQKLIKIPKQ